MQLSLDYDGNSNQKINPPSFMIKSIDTLSRSLGHLSTQLTTLAVNLNQMSPDIFYFSELAIRARTEPIHWPNLTNLHIMTGFATAAGGYSMRRADTSLPRPQIVTQHGHESWSDSDLWDEEQRLEHEFGNEPIYQYRVRPKPAYFDSLAVKIARAAICMPKLNALSLDIPSYNAEYHSHYGYQHWGFHFRSGNHARHGR